MGVGVGAVEEGSEQPADSRNRRRMRARGDEGRTRKRKRGGATTAGWATYKRKDGHVESI